MCDVCKHIRSAVIGLAHALCRGTWQARRCVVIVLVLRNSGCTTVYNKSKLTVTEAHTTTLQCLPLIHPDLSWNPRYNLSHPKCIIMSYYSTICHVSIISFCLKC